jgi:hypothetical protein
MISRQIQLCENCPYKPVDVGLSISLNGKKLNICDIDLVIEVGKRIEAIAELKRYANASAYSTFFLPAHEYVLLKKVAKMLRSDSFFIVFDGKEFFVTEIDRFEKREAVSVNGRNQKQILFSRSEFARMKRDELKRFFARRYGGKE